MEDSAKIEVSQLTLGRMLEKLDSIEGKMTKFEDAERRIQLIEREQSLLKRDLEEIKEIIKAPKASWFTVVSGIAGIASIVLALLVVIPILAGK